jgi:hypothetical protein
VKRQERLMTFLKIEMQQDSLISKLEFFSNLLKTDKENLKSFVRRKASSYRVTAAKIKTSTLLNLLLTH